jgi:hypothetical protein
LEGSKGRFSLAEFPSANHCGQFAGVKKLNLIFKKVYIRTSVAAPEKSYLPHIQRPPYTNQFTILKAYRSSKEPLWGT